MRTFTTILLMLGFVAATALIILPLQVRTDHSYLCAYTGSRRGYTEWRLGGKGPEWYKKSPLEEFIEKKHPSELRHDWQLIGGTGKNIFGGNVSFGCGLPAAYSGASIDIIARYCAKSSDEQKLETYRSFVNATTREEQHRLSAAFVDAAIGQDEAIKDGGTNAVHEHPAAK